nr:hypothetical protein GCM10025730_35570 [Promicromonospora thailandica]
MTGLAPGAVRATAGPESAVEAPRAPTAPAAASIVRREIPVVADMVLLEVGELCPTTRPDRGERVHNGV